MLTDRLEPVQRFERLFLDAVEAGTVETVRSIEAQDRRALRRSLVNYHRRRAKIVPEFLERLLDA